MVHGDDPLAAVEAARAKIDADIAAAESRLADIDELADKIRSASVTVRSPRGEVAVTAQPTGRVASVEFSAAAERLATRALSRLVAETIAHAQHRAALTGIDLSAHLLGTESPLLAQMRREALDAFPAPASDANPIRYH